MAFRAIAASSSRRRGGRRPLRLTAPAIAAIGALLCAVSAVPASAQKANISGLSDLTFASVSLSSDTQMNEDVCVYSSTVPSNYRVTATGSGNGGAFDLASGGNSLAYQVQWSPSPGQTSGTPLVAGSPLTAQSSNATQKTCNNGPATSASLIVIIPASAVAAATAGAYSGTLSLLVAPE